MDTSKVGGNEGRLCKTKAPGELLQEAKSVVSNQDHTNCNSKFTVLILNSNLLGRMQENILILSLCWQKNFLIKLKQ